MTKTFTELEQIGIVGMCKAAGLIIITKDGILWKYNPDEKLFYFKENLM